METPTVSFEGTLEKTSGVFKNKTKVWMVLQDLSLTYYKNNKRSSCIGSVDMVTVQSVAQKKTMSGGKKFEIITATNSYHFEAETSELCEAWVKVLQQSMALKSTLSGSECATTQDEERNDRSSGTPRKERSLSSTFHDELETLPASPTVFGVKLKSTRHSRKSCDLPVDRDLSPSSPKSPKSPGAQVDKPKSKFSFGHIGKRAKENKDTKNRNEETYRRACTDKQISERPNMNAACDFAQDSNAKQLDKDWERAKDKDAFDPTRVASDVNDDRSNAKPIANDTEKIKEILPKSDTEKENLIGITENANEDTKIEKQQPKKCDAGLIISATNVERDQVAFQVNENIDVLRSSFSDDVSTTTENSETKKQCDETIDKGSDANQKLDQESTVTISVSEQNANAKQSVKNINGASDKDVFDGSHSMTPNIENEQLNGIYTNEKPTETNANQMTEVRPINDTEHESAKESNENVDEEIDIKRNMRSKDDREITISDAITAKNEQIHAGVDGNIDTMKGASRDTSSDTVNDTKLEFNTNTSSDESVDFKSYTSLNKNTDSVDNIQNQKNNMVEITEVTLRKAPCKDDGEITISDAITDENEQTDAGIDTLKVDSLDTNTDTVNDTKLVFNTNTSLDENVGFKSHTSLNENTDSVNKLQNQTDTAEVTEVTLRSSSSEGVLASEKCNDNDISQVQTRKSGRDMVISKAAAEHADAIDISQVQMRKSGRDMVTSKATADNFDDIDLSQVEMRKSSRSRSTASYKSEIERVSEMQTNSYVNQTRNTDSSTKLERLRSLKESLSISDDSEANADDAKDANESLDINKQSKLENLNLLCANGDTDEFVFTVEVSAVKPKENLLSLDAYKKLTAFVKQVDKNYDVEYHRLSSEYPVAALEAMLSNSF